MKAGSERAALFAFASLCAVFTLQHLLYGRRKRRNKRRLMGLISED